MGSTLNLDDISHADNIVIGSVFRTFLFTPLDHFGVSI